MIDINTLEAAAQASLDAGEDLRFCDAEAVIELITRLRKEISISNQRGEALETAWCELSALTTEMQERGCSSIKEKTSMSNDSEESQRFTLHEYEAVKNEVVRHESTPDYKASFENACRIITVLRKQNLEFLKKVPLTSESVLSYIYTLLEEVQSRGGMFPQDSKARESDSDAIHKTADLVRGYAKEAGGYPSLESVKKTITLRARNSGTPAPSFITPTSQEEEIKRLRSALQEIADEIKGSHPVIIAQKALNG